MDTVKPRGMSRVDAARYVGVSRATMDRLIEAGAVKTKLIGGRRVVDVHQLDEWFDSLPAERDAS